MTQIFYLRSGVFCVYNNNISKAPNPSIQMYEAQSTMKTTASCTYRPVEEDGVGWLAERVL